ncbi:MAG: hypothetical protein ACFE96_13030 [Candidatus Hermodarchaeota archaeon]
MKKNILRIILLIFLTQILLSSASLVINSNATPIQTTVGFGTAPVIDGVLDVTTNEWNSARKLNISLFQNLVNQSDGLPLDFWILQAESSINFFIRFDLNDHSSSEYDNEFLGILVADWEDSLNFTDAKIVQFSDISENTLQYLDFYIADDVYNEDVTSDGEGYAILDGNEIVYEFSMPVEVEDGGFEDVELEHGVRFDFKVIFGKTPTYPDGILISNILSIYLEFLPGAPPEDISELVMTVSTIIIFSTIGALYVFYLYRITQLKKKIERIRS